MASRLIDRTIGLAVLLAVLAWPVRAASVLDFEDAATGSEFSGDTPGATAGPFLIDGLPTTFTTQALAPGGSLAASSFGLGVSSGGSDPDPGSFNIGESWHVTADRGLNLLGIDLGGVQAEEVVAVASSAWIGLAGISPGSPSVVFHPPSGHFFLTDMDPPDRDIFDLVALTGGAPLPLPAGAELTVSLVTSIFGPNDDVELSTLTFSAAPDVFDFGDAPDPTYPTLVASGGARHRILSGYQLGGGVDDESDGQPSAQADGDGADDDGVVFTSPLRLNVLPTPASLEVTASAAAKLDAWIDFNQDGDWRDGGEQIFGSEALDAGVNGLVFEVPTDAVLGCLTFARFRLSSAGGLAPGGMAADGEVEDHAVSIVPDDDLDLFNRTLSEDEVFTAARSITAGGGFTTFPDLSILAPASVVFHAAQFVVLNNGVFVEEGATLTVKTEPVLTCPPPSP